MDFDNLISSGWSEHHDDLQAVSKRLIDHVEVVSGVDQVGKYASLLLHVYGNHQGLWSDACATLEGIVSRVEGADRDPAALVSLAVAQTMAGKTSDALITEARASIAASSEPLGPLAQVRARLGEQLVTADDVDSAAPLFALAATLGASLGDDASAHRTLAISANNAASHLVEKKGRTSAEDDAMRTLAALAKRHWTCAGTWVNWQRADYLLALVHNVLHEFDEAKTAAERGLATIAENGEEEVDRAFLSLQLASACRGVGQPEAFEQHLATAKGIAAGFDQDWMKTWFAEELGKVVPG